MKKEVDSILLENPKNGEKVLPNCF